MKKWVIGDIHGEYEKLIALLQTIDFHYENDQLISLGDIVDRGANSFKCVEELLKIKNLIAIRGNHDACFRDSIKTGHSSELYDQGGRETMLSYTRDTECNSDPCKIPWQHIDFFINKQINYHIDEENNLFVHGGFNRHEYIEKQKEDVLLWDRDLFLAALSYQGMKNNIHAFKTKNKFNRIFIGHTPTIYWGSKMPIKAANIINLDTGCGKGNYPLSIMNLKTEEVFQTK